MVSDCILDAGSAYQNRAARWVKEVCLEAVTVTQQNAERPIPTLPKNAIQVRLEAVGLEETAPHRIAKPVTVIGSRRDCDYTLVHPDVSRVHCTIVHTGAAVFVCDLRSRCGTYVNNTFANVTELIPKVKLRVGPIPINVHFETSDSLVSSWRAAQAERQLTLGGTLGTHVLQSTAAVIGRRQTCDVVVDTPETSLAHTLIFFLQGAPVLFDLGSRSGTYLNGSRIDFSWLLDGDELNIGGVTMSVAWKGPVGFDPNAASAPASSEPKPAKQPAARPSGQPRASAPPATTPRSANSRASVPSAEAQAAESVPASRPAAPARPVPKVAATSAPVPPATPSAPPKTADAAQTASNSGKPKPTAEPVAPPTKSAAGEPATAAGTTPSNKTKAAATETKSALQSLKERLFGPRTANSEPAMVSTDAATNERPREDSREAEIRRREEQVSSRLEAIQRQEAQWKRIADELNTRSQTLLQHEQALEAARVELQALENELKTRAARLERAEAKTTTETNEYWRLREILDSDRSEFDERLSAYEEKLGELGQREARVAAREDELNLREAGIAEREAAQASAAEQLDALRDSILQAIGVVNSDLSKAFPEGFVGPQPRKPLELAAGAKLDELRKLAPVDLATSRSNPGMNVRGQQIPVQ